MSTPTADRRHDVRLAGPAVGRVSKAPGTGWKTIRMYLGLALIIIWGLAPFYWMIVTPFRNVGYTFDTTPWPTHVTLDNFRDGLLDRAAATTSARRWSTASIIGDRHDRRRDGWSGCSRRTRMARLQFRGKYLVLGFILGASMFPGRRAGVPAVPAVLQHRLADRVQLPGADHPGHLVRATADGLHVDRVLQRDAVGPGGVGPDRRLHPGPGVPAR